MLDGDVAVAVGALEAVGLVKNGIEALAQIDIVGCGAEARLACDPGLQFLAQAAHIHSGLLQNAAGQTLLGKQGRQQVLALHLLLALLLGQLLGGDYGAPGLFGEQFGGGMHGNLWNGAVLQSYGQSQKLAPREAESAGRENRPMERSMEAAAESPRHRDCRGEADSHRPHTPRRRGRGSPWRSWP